MAVGRIVLVVVAVVAVIALALGLGLGLGLRKSKKDISEYYNRIDCYPEMLWGDDANTNRTECEERGCCYSPTTFPSVPVCYVCLTGTLGVGYSVPVINSKGNTITYVLSGRKAAKGAGQRRTLVPSANAVFEVEMGNPNVLHFKTYPVYNDGVPPRYEVPKQVLNISLSQDNNATSDSLQRQYAFTVTNHEPFTFQITRVSTGTVIFDTSVDGGLVLSDQFLSISTKLASPNIYGIGENTHTSFRHNLTFRTWPLFARDQPTGGTTNHYGVHPFYMVQETDGNCHGVFLLNSNAMDYSLTPLPMITYRTIGGVLDFYVILGPSPESVVQQYTSMIGRPYMPPYWALGFQLCRYGYNSLANLSAAVERTKAADIPHDVQYADIDHYEERRVFTVDNVSFAGLADYFKSLQDGGMSIIIILDPCIITNVTGYEPFTEGMKSDIFIRWPDRQSMPPADYDVTNTTAMLGYVWPKGQVVFPDFLRANATEVWSRLIVKHQKLLPFDGLWIDMNEPANFGTNEERIWNWPEDALPYWSLKCPTGQLDDPPYRTMASFEYDKDTRSTGRPAARISDKTICMIARQGDQAQYQHYDVHNLYGISQLPPTLSGLRESLGGSKRGIVVGRSTFVGSGHLSGHWLGDNYSDWPNLRESIIGMLEFNLFGIPYIGADICGFFGETTNELCGRWMQLGAFYPYSRNHNGADSTVNQDPGAMSELVQTLSRDALRTRYSLLPYLYTLFHLAHTHGDTVVRPLHHEFPTDTNTWGIDRQFLWGRSLLIAPILEEGQTVLSYYLPVASRWFDFYTNALSAKSSSGGGGGGGEKGEDWLKMEIKPNSSIPLFVRGGSILPMQDPANNTHYSRLNAFHLRVYLDEEDQASGQLFWDDGNSIDTYENGEYYLTSMTCDKKVLRMSVQHANVTDMSSLVIQSVTVAGVTSPPTAVHINSTIEHIEYTYSPDVQALVVYNLTMSLIESWTLSWS